jgi:hypothetical protein
MEKDGKDQADRASEKLIIIQSQGGKEHSAYDKIGNLHTT